MRFDPQADFVPRTKTVNVAPILAPPPVLGARSPLKTAVVIVVLGFVAGLGMWLLSDGVPGQKEAAADTTEPRVDSAIVRYAEAVISGKTEADRVEAATGTSIEHRLTGAARRSGGIRAQDEFRAGQLAMGMGDHKQAVVHFKEAIRIDANFADAHYRLGVAYVQLGRMTDARREQAFLKQLGDDRANLLGHLVDN